ncbi:RagB/SusD family nutrient uptake outer membrane protein [Bacteroides sp.]|uniref:RagB/SusD family nutrient uptake outer membrane protein n=1 Tax=Bacteroides sp. TaxID=29523 RepID=UPI002A819590|nr:RagB/SusD family nutrient uptake outer membrane protein [Bacteroides sp.]
MKRYILTIITSCLLFVNFSCNDFLEEKVVSKATMAYYEIPEGIDAVVNSIYSKMRWPFSGERFHNYALFGTDLFMTATGTHGNAWDQYQATALNASTSLLYSLWTQWYEAISACNTGLYYIEDMNENASWKNQRTAEMRFFRAYFLFDLMQQFGAIPMPLEPVFEAQTYIPRTPVDKVYTQIIEDLKYCADYNYLPKTAERGRVRIGAAQHLLAKVYLTRGSAVSAEAKATRGTQDMDLAEAARYADLVIGSSEYELEKNFADIFLLDNKDSKEVILTVNYTKDEMWNGEGNPMHMYSTGSYTNQPGMIRDIANGRPWSRIRQTFWVMEDQAKHGGLFDYTNDSRGEKTFKSVWYSNNSETIPKWADIKDGSTVIWSPSAALKGKPKFEVGDTCIVMRPIHYKGIPLAEGGFESKRDSLILFGSQDHNLWTMERIESVRDFWPIIEKWANGDRPDIMYEPGHRNFNVYRLGETYLIAAEAYGRQGLYDKAADRLNEVRKRAAYKSGEWRSNLNVINGKGEKLTSSTESKMTVKEADLSSLSLDQFVDLMLDERGRELIGEDNRWNDLNRCEKLIERFKAHNAIGGTAGNIQPYHVLRPIPQNHIDRLDPAGALEVEQNKGWY